MRIQAKLVRDGNSWSIRLPKKSLLASSIKPDDELIIRGTPGRVTIYSAEAAKKLAGKDKFEVAKQDARQAWDEAFEQVWLDVFGVD